MGRYGEKESPADRSHPEREGLERFVRGESEGAESQSVVLHLLRGCPQCQRVVRAFWYRTEAPLARMVLAAPVEER
jgi:hypothetical protein